MTKAKNAKIEISLTDFVDFVCKVGSSKLTHVKQIKNREGYSPASDFYKGIREGIVNNHQTGGDTKSLKKVLEEVTDKKKIRNYEEAIEGYKKFWGRKKIKFFAPPSSHWRTGDLEVRINPELGLEFEDKLLIVKLYFKKDKLRKEKITQILTLMEDQLRAGQEKEVRMAVLDIKNSKIFIKEDDDFSLLPLLDGEARNFEVIWNGV